jgi:tetratricopeptide (TPR) repeat protein
MAPDIIGSMKTPLRFLPLACLLASLPAAAWAQHQHSSCAAEGAGFSPCSKQYAPATLLPGLGQLNHPVSTKNPEAQRFFNQGLTLVYGFNHEEAARSFRRAAQLDPTLAMAYWGIALSVGPNINIDIDPSCEQFAYSQVQKAMELAKASPTSPAEIAYIEALSKRYSDEKTSNRQQLAVSYMVAMGELVRQFPNDLDAATLYAESIMDLRPWKLWDNCGKPAQDTEEILRVIESVLKRDAKHIGANHYKIHALEASTTPQNAQSSAVLLETLVPNAGHLRHMPSHIYARIGRYDLAALANVNALRVDEPYLRACAESIDAPECLPIYVGHYYSHNLLFLSVAYGMQARSEAQIMAQRAADNALRYIRQQPGLEHFLPTPPMMLTRFGRWDEILKANPPYDPALHISNAMWHWARGMAYAATKQLGDAATEQAAFAQEVQNVPACMSWGNNSASAMFAVAENMLRAKIAGARGQSKAAVEFLRLALDAEVALVYDEPDPWFIPVREALGMALLHDRDYKAAEQVFRADLKQHPESLRALLGMAESLRAQGQVKAANAFREPIERARKQANLDVSLDQM